MARLVLANEEILTINDNSNQYDIIFSELNGFDDIKRLSESLTNDSLANFKIIRDYEDGTSSEEEHTNFTISSFSFDASGTSLHAYLSSPPSEGTDYAKMREEINRLTELNESLTDRANAADILMGGI